MTVLTPVSALLANTVEDGDCLRYQGYHDDEGYGRIGGKLVHRRVYQETIGPIPEELTIDHVWSRGCRFKDCIRIAHLEAVPASENYERGVQARHAEGRKIQRHAPLPTHCRNEHEYTPENTYMFRETRYCRQCNLDRVRRYNDRKANQ